MQEELEMLEYFNSKYQKHATFVRRSFEYDLDDAYTVSFYELVEGIEPSLGFCFVREVGGFNGGLYYTSYNKDKAGYFVCDGNKERGYPLDDGSLSIGYLRIGYKATHFETNSFHSTLVHQRYWISDIDEIAKKYPEMAEKVTQFLNGHISHLADIQSQRGYKSTWVYYKYQEKLDTLLRVVNGQMLRDTCWFYCPIIHFNRFSSKIVRLSDREKAELNRTSFLDWG